MTISTPSIKQRQEPYKTPATMIHKFSKYDIEDIEQEAERYPVTEERIEHGKKFPTIIGWAVGIMISLAGWGYLIFRLIVRP